MHEIRLELRGCGFLDITRGHTQFNDEKGQMLFTEGRWSGKAPEGATQTVSILGDGGYLRLARADVPEFIKALKAVAS
jgi:hypothetical protein